MRSVLVFLLLVFCACETKEHADAEVGAIKKAQDAAAKSSAQTNAGGVEEMGIPECDSYIRKYEACLADKVPAEAQTRLRRELNDQVKKWRFSATDSFARTNVADQCRSAIAVAKQSMAGYGCDF
jgi:hypothetical protein